MGQHLSLSETIHGTKSLPLVRPSMGQHLSLSETIHGTTSITSCVSGHVSGIGDARGVTLPAHCGPILGLTGFYLSEVEQERDLLKTTIYGRY